MDVITISATKEGFDGVFYPAKQPGNAIIFVSGSEGGLGTGKKIAAYYQSSGYSALALGLFHTKNTNRALSEVPLEYMERAIAWLKKRGYDRIIADGISRGSEYVLYAAAVMPEIHGVIARVPSYFISEGLTDKTPSSRSAWTYRGKPLPYTPYKTRKINKLKIWMKEKQFSLMSMNENKEVAPSSVIPVEKIHGPVLLMATQADTVWPSAAYMQRLTERFAQTHFPYAVQAMTFQHVSHMLVPILHKKSLKLIRMLFRSERLHPEECAKERDEMEKATLNFLRKTFAFDREHDQMVTEAGNPANPQGEAGKEMLRRMNESHFPMALWALDFLNFRLEDKALDIGCGGGAVLGQLVQRIQHGKIYGVDYSKISVGLSVEANRQAVEDGKLSVIEASVEKLPFDDDTFDKITTFESFYFWPSPVENLKEVRRVLKKGGHFLLAAAIHQNGNLPDRACENIQKYNMLVPSAAEFQEYLHAAGFCDMSVRTREGELWIAVDAKK